MTTVIVPVYNAAPFLERCVASVREQTVSDWKMIIVDDGSTDGSGDIAAAAAAADSRIRLVEQPNRGVSAARNAAIALADTEFIVFLDADDEYSPDALELMLRRAAETGADMVCAGMTEGDERPEEHDMPVWHTVGGRQAAIDTLYQVPPWHTGPCSKLYRRSLFDNVLFREDIRYEDLEIMPRLLEQCRKVDVTSCPLYFYRRNSASFMQRWSDRHLDAVAVTESLEKHYSALPPSDFTAEMTAAARSRRFSALCNIAALASAAGDTAATRKCVAGIRSLRRNMLRDGRVRARNKIAAGLSWLPEPVLLWLLRRAVR